MTWIAAGVIVSLTATVFALLTDNAALMILGFFAFALSLCAGDHAADDINHNASDSLNRFRVGIDKADERW